MDLQVVTTPYPFERAEDALTDLAEDRVDGAAVLTVDQHWAARAEKTLTA